MNTTTTENNPSRTSEQVKPGYKKTPIGIIPEEWEVKEMGEVSKVNQGLQIPIADRYTEKVEGSYFYITNEFLKKGSKKNYYIKDPPKSVICSEDDILMTRTGNTGSVVTGVNGAFHNNFFKIKYDTKSILKEFLYTFLIYPRTQFNILVLAGNSTIPDLNHSEFYKLNLPIPPLPEQKAIADCLSTWDKGIEKLSALIQSKKEQKKGLMQGLFNGQLTIKNACPEQGRKKQLIQAKEGEDFTEEWEEIKLGEIGETFNGLRGKQKDDFGEGQPYVAYLNVFNSNKIDEKTKFDLVKIKPYENQNRVKYGDLLFTTSSETPDEVGMSSVVLIQKEELYLNSFCFGLRLNNFEKLTPAFSVYLLRSNSFRKEMYTLAQGSTRFNLSKTGFKKINMFVPKVKEQIAIAEVLTAADKEIEILEKKLANFKTQKKGLMQVLLTGERRLIDN